MSNLHKKPEPFVCRKPIEMTVDVDVPQTCFNVSRAGAIDHVGITLDDQGMVIVEYNPDNLAKSERHRVLTYGEFVKCVKAIIELG